MTAAGLTLYDGSFAGWLTLVHDTFGSGGEAASLPARVEVEADEHQGGLFGSVRLVTTDAAKAERSERALGRHLGAGGVERLYHAFLSEASGMEADLLRLVARVVEHGASALDDLRFLPALRAERMKGRVRREVHRMHAFVRFEERRGRYVAEVRPDHNVLPLIGDHFEARYPALDWAIVDVARGYALWHTAVEKRGDGEPATRFVPAGFARALPEAREEGAYQRLWQAYYAAVTIPERRNLELHRRHVPKRYWPYLTEKRAALRAT